MRVPSGKTDQYIYFVAYDSADHTTRKTGLTGFAVYRSRNNGAATAYTTPTVAELSAANMPGIYALLLDEDTTIAAGSDSEEYCVHITVSGMDPVTRAIELYRRDTTSGKTAVVDASGLIDANVVKLGPSGSGTAQTARDIGASVLLSAGSGTGQLDFTSGVVKANLAQILGTALTETAGQIAAAFKQFFNIASPTSTMNEITLVDTTTNLTNGVTVTTNSDKTGYALTSGERNSVADALLDRDMSLGADNGSTTVRTVRQALRALRNKWAIVAGTATIYKEDDTTASWTSTVTTTADTSPVTSSDPAG